MSVRITVKRAVRRQAAAASVVVPAGEGPQWWRSVVGRAHAAEARRRLVADKDPVAAQALLDPLLDSPAASRAWTVTAEVRERSGDPAAALAAARRAVSVDPTFAARVTHARLALAAGSAEESAATAAQFGIEPRVAMLSYSTGSSGSGAEVERVREATELVRAREPALSVEGPIQYDAAVDAGVARTKLPESEVAGRATVFIFPDLNTGNNTYKAVQQSSGAVAVGPVLQGLRKPVNDLSRGCTVEDIVNTVAITAIQAQSLAAPAEPSAAGSGTEPSAVSAAQA